jgi:hypothetical protein
MLVEMFHKGRDDILLDQQEMSSLYFGLDVFCLVPCPVSKTLASDRQKTVSPKYKDDITLLI